MAIAISQLPSWTRKPHRPARYTAQSSAMAAAQPGVGPALYELSI